MVTQVSGLHNHNISTALAAQNEHSQRVSNSLERLSTGSDLVKGEKSARQVMDMVLKSQIDLYGQSQRNALDARAVLSVADAYIKSDIKLLDKMKLLSAEAISGSLDSKRRALIQNEFSKLQSQIDLNANMGKWLDTQLLKGGGGGGVTVATPGSAVTDTATTTAASAVLAASIGTGSVGDFDGAYVAGSLTVTQGSEASAWKISFDVSAGGNKFTYIADNAKFANSGTIDFKNGNNVIQAVCDASVTAPTTAAAVTTAFQTWLNDGATTSTGATFTSGYTDPTGVNGFTSVTAGAGTVAGAYRLEYVADSAKLTRFDAFGSKEQLTVAAGANTAVFSDGMAVNLGSGFALATAIPAFKVTVAAGSAVSLTYQLDEAGNSLTATVPNATAAALGVSSINVSTATSAATALTAIGNAQQSLQSASSILVAQMGQLEAVDANLKAATRELGVAQSANNTDLAKSLADYVQANAMSGMALQVATVHAVQQTRDLVDAVKRA